MTTMFPCVHSSCLINRRPSVYEGVDYVEIDQTKVDARADAAFQESIQNTNNYSEKLSNEARND
jgi:hypothetical protein